MSLNQLLGTFLRSWQLFYLQNPFWIGWFEMSISVKLKFQFYTELELLKVAAGTFDPTPTLLGLKGLDRLNRSSPNVNKHINQFCYSFVTITLLKINSSFHTFSWIYLIISIQARKVETIRKKMTKSSKKCRLKN